MGTYDDRNAIARGARNRQPRPERRKTCGTCNGAGEVTKGTFLDPVTNARMPLRVTCGTCNGAGKVSY